MQSLNYFVIQANPSGVLWSKWWCGRVINRFEDHSFSGQIIENLNVIRGDEYIVMLFRSLADFQRVQFFANSRSTHTLNALSFQYRH